MTENISYSLNKRQYGKYTARTVTKGRIKKSEYRAQNRMCRLVIGFILIILLSSGMFAMKSFAGNSIKPASYKYYTSIEVLRGDTLNSIAAEYMENGFSSKERYIAEIANINHLLL